MKILITGVNGFIGQHLAQALIFRGHFVVGLDLEENPLIKNINHYFSGEILDKRKVKKAIQGVEVVIHLAALTGYQETVDKEKILKVNFEGTRNILETFLKSSAKKFIYPSTGKVYGDIKFLPLTEEHPTLPLSIYGKSKLLTEGLIDFYSNLEKSFIIFRIFNVFGQGQKDNFLVPTILNQIKESNQITLGDIKARRDYIYIKDVIAAFVLAVEKEIKTGLSIFNICSGKDKSAKEIVSEISKIKGFPIEIKVNPDLFRKDEKDIEYGSYQKAKKILGWHPECSLKKGLEEIIKLIKYQ